jgi:uncharacterized protein (TIGR02145 family)
MKNCMVNINLNKFFCLIVMMLGSLLGHAQDPVTLQFTGQNQNGQHIPLTTVLVENTSKHWQEVLYYPDTTLFIGHTGVEEIEQLGNGVRLFQNVPNPFDGVTDFALQLPEASDVQLEIYDLNGKVTATYQGSLDPGCHQFRAWLAAPQTYLLQAQTDNGTFQIKMVNTGKAGQNRIEYIGKGNTLTVENLKSDSKGSSNLPFNYGDIMTYIGYTHLANTEFTSETVMKAQYNSELLPLIFTLPLPTVTTEAATNIYSTEAWLNGSVIENAEYPVTERGFLLADNEQLTDAVQHLADDGDDNFHCAIHNLQIATRYYYRAYAQTALGISYGDVRFFDTQAEMPVVQTFEVENITPSSATCGGEVTADGGTNVTARGICWGTSQNPTINESYTTDGSGTGAFSSTLTGLSPNTAYYVRAYATNSVGTAYGQQTSFTTLANLPEVSTSSVTNITSSSATCSGNVISNGGDIITARGICWSTSQNPSLNDSHTSEGTGIGYFSSNITGLTAGTTYYVRAYATNSAGTAYGQQTSFTALDLPVVSTGTVTNITVSTATCGGQVIGTGGSNVTARGVCWSTSQNPTINNSHTSDGSDIGSFTSHIVGLSPNTTYYVRAYATNSVGTAYGEERYFATASSATSGPFYCGIDSVTDYDGNVYHTVEIGQQCWMKENLRTTHYTDGIAIPIDTIHSSTVAYRYTPYGDSLLVLTYGYLYNWTAVMHGEPTSSSNPSEVQGICPTGWHVPSDAEWMELTDYMGTQPAYTSNCNDDYLAKALSDTEGWYITQNLSNRFTPGFDPTTNNTSGFSAQPAGAFNYSYEPSGYFAYFWSATECNESNALFRLIQFDSEHMETFCHNKEYGKSVRCLLDGSGVDSSNAVLPVVTTQTIDNIMSSTASCGGVMIASGGTPITAHGICWSTSPFPTVNDNITVDGNNLGNFTSHISGLSANTTYYVRAYATTSMGTTYGEERNFTTTASDVSGTSHCGNDSLVTDYDGNSYSIVEIGTQCWMKENLRTTHYADGTAILLGNPSIGFSSPYREIPGENLNDEDNLAYVPTHGFLYNWLAVMHDANSSNDCPSGVQGICPTGWHVPSDTEWMELINYMATHPAYAASNDNTHLAKALSASWGWDRTSIADAPGHNPTSNNATGFSALPTGISHCLFGELASFWSCTYNSDNTAYFININNYQAAVERTICYIADARSVRCLRD